jgi:hypothetical protein
VLVSDHVDEDTVFWGVPKAHMMFVQRKGTKVERFPNVKQDGIWIRATFRLGLAFLKRGRCGSRLRRCLIGCATTEYPRRGRLTTAPFRDQGPATRPTSHQESTPDGRHRPARAEAT